MRRDIKGLGMTDSLCYAALLAEKFDYKNTYYHQDPRLDISAQEIHSDLLASQDFVISSDVFEHVAPPLSRAFRNVWSILKPGGTLVLTVPYTLQKETMEHFPELHEFNVIRYGDSYVLQNITKDGVSQAFDLLAFHGGPGSTLELRIFAKRDLIRHLTEAGFRKVTVHRAPDFSYGIWWPQPWSWPISARK